MEAVESLARTVYREHITHLAEQFEKHRDLISYSGYSLARDALRYAKRNSLAEDLFASYAWRFHDIVTRSPHDTVAIAPVFFGGHIFGKMLHDFARRAVGQGLLNKRVVLVPIIKKPGRQFEFTPPRERHLFVVVDDAMGSGNTHRMILRQHPNPRDVVALPFSVVAKDEHYRAAKMLATLSYIDLALQGKPELLNEIVEKSYNPKSGEGRGRWDWSGRDLDL